MPAEEATAAQPLLLDPEFRQQLKRLRLAAARLATSRRRGQRASRQPGAGLEFAGHRAYSPGDDIRFLDWNALGRLDQLVLKQFESPGELTVVLAPDCSLTMRFGEPDKFRHGLELAAAVGSLSLHAGDRVLVHPLSGSPEQAPRQLSGSVAEPALLETLSRLKPAADKVPLGTWLGAVRDLRGDVLVVLPTDFLDSKAVLATLSELAKLKARCIVLHVVAPQEVHPELTGRNRISLLGPSEQPQVTLEVDAATLEEYRREFEKFRQAMISACIRARAGLVGSLTSWGFESVVLALVSSGMLKVKRS